MTPRFAATGSVNREEDELGEYWAVEVVGVGLPAHLSVVLRPGRADEVVPAVGDESFGPAVEAAADELLLGWLEDSGGAALEWQAPSHLAPHLQGAIFRGSIGFDEEQDLVVHPRARRHRDGGYVMVPCPESCRRPERCAGLSTCPLDPSCRG